jgi:hypothetical protein
MSPLTCPGTDHFSIPNLGFGHIGDFPLDDGRRKVQYSAFNMRSGYSVTRNGSRVGFSHLGSVSMSEIVVTCR